MGYWVLSKIYIDFKKRITKKTIDRIREIIKEIECSNLYFESQSIFFETGGNKGVEYDFLDKIKKEFKDKIQTINANEYIESDGGGYYWENENVR